MYKYVISSLSYKNSLKSLPNKKIISHSPIALSMVVLLIGILVKETAQSFYPYLFVLATLPVIIAALYASRRDGLCHAGSEFNRNHLFLSSSI